MNKSPKWEGIVKKATLPIRINPRSTAKEHSFSPAHKGDKVRVCDTSRGWYYVEWEGHYGYVSSKWVKFSTSYSAKPSTTLKWVGKMNHACRLRKTTKAGILASLQIGTVVTVCDTIDGYWYVSYDGKRGYIPARYVTFLTAANDKAGIFLATVKEVQEYARRHSYIWADSRSTVPAADGKISCDRLVARALWNMGYTDQIKGGIALGRGFEEYLIKHGFTRSTNMKDAKPGSVFVVMNPSGSSRHVFVIASRKGNTYTRYDCGSTEWIRSKQPLPGLWMSWLIALYNIG